MSITWENTPQTQEFSVVPIINQKVKTAGQGLKKRVYLIALTYLSRYLKNKKSFEAIIAQDLSAYINSLYKDQTQDPNQSWISTQRTMGLALLKFFKWLPYPDLTPQQRKRLPRELQP
jgi:hypothetical protein